MGNKRYTLASACISGHHRGVPTVLRVGSYRFFFYSADGQEPPHVHIARDRAKAKFWLEPVAYASASGFSARELLDIQSLIVAHQQLLLKFWHDYFDPAD